MLISKKTIELLKDVNHDLEEGIIFDPQSLDITPLRRFHEHVSEMMFTSKEPFERYICFFFSSFLSTVFLNFGGDSVYSKTFHKLKIEFYTSLLKFLKQLVISFENNEKEVIFTALCDLTSLYITEINYLNQNFH